MKKLLLNIIGLFLLSILYEIGWANLIFAERTTAFKPTEIRLNQLFEKNLESINLIETLILISKDWDPSIDEKLLQMK